MAKTTTRYSALTLLATTAAAIGAVLLLAGPERSTSSVLLSSLRGGSGHHGRQLLALTAFHDPKSTARRAIDASPPPSDETHFRIKRWNSAGGYFEIEVVAPKPGHQYSVTINSPNKYTGTAQLLTSTAYDGEESLVYAWKPVLPLDDYRIEVHELVPGHCCNARPTTTSVHPSPLEFAVKPHKLGGAQGMALQLDQWNSAPPCQSMTNVDALSTFDGSWIGPDLHHDNVHGGLGNALRSGWAFLPSPQMGCKIESFSREDLLSIPGEKERHIYVVGTSVMRGVFQGLIDLWLPQEDKANFMPSIVHRCWGRADLKKGNLRLTYQDLRTSAMEAPEEVGKNHIECHNGKVAKEDGEFLKSAYALWEEIFHDPSKWPDVIFFGSGYRWTDKHDFETHTLWFAKNLPPAWKGTIVFSGGEFHGGLAGLGSLEKYNQYRAEIRQMLAAMNDPRVRWLDGMGVSSNHRLYTEIGPKSISGSAHFHDRSYKPVYEPSGEIVSKIRFKSQMVVSNVTDIVGQILLGHALGPKEQFLKQVEAANSHGIGEKAELETCTHCPKSLMPFRLIPYPELRCSTGPIERYDPVLDEVEERPVRDCPRYCMRQEPEWSFPSQSDTVFVRQCPARPPSELRQQRRRAKQG